MAEVDSNRGPSAYQSNALPLGQTGSQSWRQQIPKIPYGPWGTRQWGGRGGGVWWVRLQFFHFSLTDLTATDFDDALRPHWNRTFIRDGRRGGGGGGGGVENESPRPPSKEEERWIRVVLAKGSQIVQPVNLSARFVTTCRGDKTCRNARERYKTADRSYYAPHPPTPPPHTHTHSLHMTCLPGDYISVLAAAQGSPGCRTGKSWLPHREVLAAAQGRRKKKICTYCLLAVFTWEMI